MKLDFTVGKYTLESLTNGMYASPLDLYREYIQNAVDSFDETKKDSKTDFKIEITIDSKEKKISIKDNGHGISNAKAPKTLLDIGNSQKHRLEARGFRGIGRLAGLSYCKKLTFITSTEGEPLKTTIVFDAQRLKQLLLERSEEELSLENVIEQIVTIQTDSEKSEHHYFEVTLDDVDMADKIVCREEVEDYLQQYCPLPFDKNFTWGSVIDSKMKKLGYGASAYKLFFTYDNIKKEIYKPYQNVFISDRVKKITDAIQDVEVLPIYRKGELSAILWYAKTDFFGTVLDNKVRGIRIRHGNILVGGKNTCNHYFKEERFNGWIVGELHVFDKGLIVNSRRDDFEKNDVYYEFADIIQEYANSITKEIRKKSYERSLTAEKQKLLEKQDDDTNALETEDLSFMDECSEEGLLEQSESVSVADGDYFDLLSKMLSKSGNQTKYSALNINPRLTTEYSSKEAEKFVTLISKKY